ncbi:polymorphic toxin-type HINT domain-containing protein [Actinoalloteichus caeruleus]|uniref:RHS repeat-associated core domain-containing protein n=2 Tax=Actinoalloteichus cyanogriseus TaxID=2893586 RepID=A0ABT1JFK6_ACTCY|nr:polymorphic toxin-type HINT domain-containing protein [Actinoalloteichus caeruleus]MCP2331280.1 RHS repeat-associated core domain-containing protein [Actinoalloteichus caeruleus DSM 43889]
MPDSPTPPDPLLPEHRRRPLRQAITLTLITSLISGTLVVTPAVAQPIEVDLPELQTEPSVPGSTHQPEPLPPNAEGENAAPRADWPEPARVEVELDQAVSPRSATANFVPVPGLPVRVGPPAIEEDAEGDSRALAAELPAPASVSVEILDQDTTTSAGVHGLLLQVDTDEAGTRQARAQEDDGGNAAISLEVDYSAFRDGYGGDWSRRLRLVRLPDCAVEPATGQDCGTGDPVEADNDTEAGTLTAPAVAAPGLYAVTADVAGDSGDYSATELSPSASWTAGGSAGNFTWSYPFRMPPSPGGAPPALALGYSSGSVDGRVASTNNQTSWVGEGWDLWSGYIERRYVPCLEDLAPGQPRTGDQCWDGDNATLVLNGSSSELFLDSSGTWRMVDDDGSRIARLTGASNGDNNGEWWRVTSTDGTQYVFGRNRHPGWTSGKPETNSAWNVPVYGNQAGEPCHGSTFATSWCYQTWRWNLDHVVDPNGNVITYYYQKELNHYGRAADPSQGTVYARSGWLERIEYGHRLNDEYAPAPARVLFGVSERCLPTDTFACNPSQLTTANAHRWPDTPYDNNCAAGQTCTELITPTFWTRKRLTSVTTQILSGSTHTDVDRWTLTHGFPASGDGTSPALWLDTIKHEGRVGGTADIPVIDFDGVQLVNRVDALEGYAPMYKRRIQTVKNETGGVLQVDYSTQDCRRTDRLPTPHTNAWRCYPVFWAPPGQQVVQDWFHKYVVTDVVEDDRTGGSEPVKTNYEYVGPAAWGYNDDRFTPEDRRSWSQWRGYERVRVTEGDDSGTQSQTEQVFLRGMDGDRRTPTGGTRDVVVTDSEGGTTRDHERLAGFLLEELTYDKPGGTVQAKTINQPWLHGPTGTSGTTRGYLTDIQRVRGYTRTDDGWQTTEVRRTFNDRGLLTQVNDLGDTSTTGDERCIRTTYAPNEARWMLSYASRIETLGVSCDVTPSFPEDLNSEVRSYYDGATDHGTPPTRGNVSRVEEVSDWDGSTRVHTTVQRTEVDTYGRAVKSTDAAGNTSTTAYTPATGGPVTEVAITDALGHTTTSELHPAWGEPLAEVDPNGLRTDLEYDPLGRLTKVWLPGNLKSDDLPNSEFSYLVRTSGPVVVTTKALQPDDDYRTSYELYDGLLRPRQTQLPSPVGGRVITDIRYDSRGLAATTNETYYNEDPPATDLLLVDDNVVPAQTRTVHDGLGRPTEEIFRKLGVEQWRTSYGYGGDWTSITPPEGGTATRVTNDARGNLIERHQYHGAEPTGDHDTTTYSYTPRGELASVVDPAGNTWTYEYDQRGRTIRTEDPDRGVTTNEYDTLGQLVRTTDSRGESLAYTYDALGRRTGLYADTTDGTRLAAWTYDTLLKGFPTASTRYVDGNAYSISVTRYNRAGRPQGTRVSIPTSEGELAGNYNYSTLYTTTGQIFSQQLPATSDLTRETIHRDYNSLGLPEKTRGVLAGTTSVEYVSDTNYSAFGEALRLQLGSAGTRSWLTHYYEEGTRRLDRIVSHRQMEPSLISDLHYSYDPAGNITSIVDRPAETAPDQTPVETQCFAYDHLRRMTDAWTPGGDCDDERSTAALGGPQPYWTSYEYDVVGNRTKETQHSADGDTVRTFTYPEAGESQPHTLLSVHSEGPGGESIDEFAYDSTGNTTSRTVSGTTQALEWTEEGRLDTVTGPDGEDTSYIYTADGARLLRKEPDGTATLYLPQQELRLEDGGVTTTRYYDHDGQVVAVRSGEDLSFLLGDHQGTSLTAVSASTMEVTRRRMSPFGDQRGDLDGDHWPGEKGFVGGTIDESTGLTSLGAREYDPHIGRFISVDPIIDHDDPQQLHGYAYANNSPVTFSDPDGLLYVGWWLVPGVGAGWTAIIASRIASQMRSSAGSHKQNQNTGSQRKQTTRVSRTYNGHTAQQISAAQATLADTRSVIDVVLDAGGKVLSEVLGLDDIKNCFTKADIVACGWVLISAVPWTKLGKIPDLLRGINRAVDRVRTWRRERDEATAVLRSAGCRVNSFVPGTLVLLADGTRKPIEDIQLGDEVLASDPDTGEIGPQRVVATITSEGPKTLVDVSHTPSPDQLPGTVTATDEHPFWVDDHGRWTHATDLTRGNTLLTPTGDHTTITHAHTYPHHHRVHNLTINTIHTYYVLAGTTPVLVHNATPKEKCDLTLGAGPNAREGVALVDGNIDASGVRELTDESGQAHGCHTCSSRSPNTPNGRWIPDHQPPSSLVSPGSPQTAYPHCQQCARIQGGVVSQLRQARSNKSW